MSRSRPLLQLALIMLLGLGCNVPYASDSSHDSQARMAAQNCRQHGPAAYQGLDPEAIRSGFRKQVENFQGLAEEALGEREKLIQGALLLREKRERNEALSGANLESIRLATLAHISLRERLIGIAEQHECWLLPLNNSQNQNQALLEIRDQAVMLALSAALLLYDNYLLAVSLYEQEGALRRIIDQADSGWGLSPGQLRQAQRLYLSEHNRQRVKRAIRHYQSHIRPQRERIEAAESRYLIGLIEQSPSFAHIQERGLPGRLLGRIGLFNQLTQDSMRGLSKHGSSLFSMLFGNAVGIVETRRGYLHNQPEVQARLLGQLRAGDILLEKTPFRLTDALIPGYWGHVAIWAGNEAELRELGIWEHPVVAPHQQAIRSGRSVIEALRPGVTANTLAKFMNVDDLLALRDPTAGKEAQAQRILRALRQIGKAYDFNFDVETTDRIVCSELVYQVFTEMSWPTSRTLGRATISPDQVAERALDERGLTVVALYKGGKAVEQDATQQLRRLLRGKDEARLALR